ncbi:hypothetical protein I543_4769 [Mycobacteroides abscessus 21]|uniref:Uncharacterized protein n=1 Tax=Mycobacteroides abscessus 21 TaxID=1299324 RepID=A0A829PZ21_9MYCO|nr:hypothetical protein I543_4769 [Mycobacteroides abscessus 21]
MAGLAPVDAAEQVCHGSPRWLGWLVTSPRRVAWRPNRRTHRSVISLAISQPQRTTGSRSGEELTAREQLKRSLLQQARTTTLQHPHTRSPLGAPISLKASNAGQKTGVAQRRPRYHRCLPI